MNYYTETDTGMEVSPAIIPPTTPSPVPLPATIWLALAAFGAMTLCAKSKSRKG